MNNGSSDGANIPNYTELGNYIPTGYQEDYDYELPQNATAGGSRLPISQTMLSQVDEKPKILLMGLRRSGKSSIQRVVFHKMAPNETLFLESTHKIEKNGNDSLVFLLF
ncbi:unnamed protein product [Trichobilharzia regenti]|nr:unnamed protein product [Trichobilharzia regenti]